jgi:hypothetical protein
VSIKTGNIIDNILTIAQDANIKLKQHFLNIEVPYALQKRYKTYSVDETDRDTKYNDPSLWLFKRDKEEDVLNLKYSVLNTITGGAGYSFKNNINITSKGYPYALWYIQPDLAPAAYITSSNAYFQYDNAYIEGEPNEQFKKMFERLGGVSPVKIFYTPQKQEKVIYLNHYKIFNNLNHELLSYAPKGNAVGHIDFLIGSPTYIDSILMVGEITGEIDILQKSAKELIPPEISQGEADIISANQRSFLDGGQSKFIYLVSNRTGVKSDEVFIGDLAGFLKYIGEGKFSYLIPKEDNVTDKAYKIRKYIYKEDKLPYIGEFVCTAVRGRRNGTKWFWQESNPYLYGGVWFETSFYSSGIVKEVLGSDPNFYYKVDVRGETLIISSTDFKKYNVDERVALIKVNSSIDDYFSEVGYRNDNYRIAPLKYYEDR